ncbi:MAG: phosphoribosylformylglycinamidine synthase subunit PurL [Aminivibrio sp.]|jgi:phosphoribosylformylglycinamidine synthase II
MDLSKYGLRQEEFLAAEAALGREPNECELRILGVMWSEHCSYKSTRHLLKLFPSTGPKVVLGPGENAGIVDLGEGLGGAFKAESHNHPSAVEPYHGAATGVGGIIRDILALGARPVAAMDAIFLGSPGHPRTDFLSSGIVKGIADYASQVGVPAVGGKTVYDHRYNENPLVNAFCLGTVDLDKVISSKTALPGQLVAVLGSKTGREGIAGAAFASVELADDAASTVTSIQTGDPLLEKRLIGACLELNERSLIVSMQDMGAAGITSSSSEVAAKSGVGMKLHFEKPPLKEEDMEAWEIALSETQERMLLIIEPQKLDEVAAVAKKWDLPWAVIGETTAEKEYSIFFRGELAASLPAELIADGCPPLLWPSAKPDGFEDRWNFDLDSLPLPKDWNEAVASLMKLPSLAPKAHIYGQFDAALQGNTFKGPGGPLAVINIEGKDSLAAMTLDADPWKCGLDPFRGGAETVARTVRVLSVAGAEPLGLTDCLNFPSPEVPGQMWAIEECVKGIAEACGALSCPVVSGNVSLYNETAGGGILPTPVVGTVGIIPSGEDYLPSGKWAEGDMLLMVGPFNSSLAGSHYLRSLGVAEGGRPLLFSGEAEKDFSERAVKTARKHAARSGRAIAGGGLAAALVKDGAESGFGASITLPVPTRKDVVLFGEGGARALYSVPIAKLPLFRSIWSGYPILELGRVEGDTLSVEGAFSFSAAELANLWRNS